MRKRLRFVKNASARTVDELRKALTDTKHPILVQHHRPMRRCNLDCTYCNEYDDVSKPVPLAGDEERLDILADMGTTIINHQRRRTPDASGPGRSDPAHPQAGDDGGLASPTDFFLTKSESSG